MRIGSELAVRLLNSMSVSLASQEELRWEACDCPCCAASERKLVYQFSRSAYHRCERCGLVYLSPRLEEACMLRLYRTESYFVGEQNLGYETYEADEDVYRMTFERRLREMAPFASPGRLLDIGCGTGLFLDVVQRAGWEACGLDASDYAVSRRPAELAGQIQTGTLESIDYPAESFDVVTMFDFFEHVYRPAEFARRVARILSPGGIAVVATPDYDSWMRRILGHRTVSFKIPEHVAYYTQRTLATAVHESFEVLHVERIGQYCTTDFVARRLASLSPALGSIFRFGVSILGAKRRRPYVSSGSLLAILTRR
jgi:2-polyprenyl-3-methyl-5-hydroxy-6-metoxy-1,4-benzoquinol methylase